MIDRREFDAFGGLPEEGVEHINHIHGGGTCAEDRAGRTAPVMIPLNNVVAGADGTASATTTIEDVTLAVLFEEDGERFILLYDEAQVGQGVPVGIAYADLVRTSGEGGASDVLPESGGTSSKAFVFVGPALLLLSYVVGLLTLRSARDG